jgi:ABC-type multidrug transport system fused ATPase/permease subunit
MLSNLKLKMLSRYLKISFLDSLKIKSSDLIIFVLNQLAVIVVIIENILILSFELSIVLGIVIFLFLFDTQTSFLLVLAICFFSLILVLILKSKLLFYGEVRRKSEADLLFVTSNLISGLKEIKLSGFIKIFLNNFNFLSVRGLRANRNFNFISQLPRSYLETIIALAIGIFLFINLLKYEEINNLTISSATVFLAAGLRILPSIGKIINSYNSYKYYIPTLDKIHKFSLLLNKKKEPKSKFIQCKKKYRT